MDINHLRYHYPANSCVAPVPNPDKAEPKQAERNEGDEVRYRSVEEQAKNRRNSPVLRDRLFVPICEPKVHGALPYGHGSISGLGNGPPVIGHTDNAARR
jgi:hypothetical protein